MIDLLGAKKIIGKTMNKAGRILMKEFEEVEVVEWKDRQDICTNLDLKIENLFIKIIKENYPDHRIMAEESGELGSESDYIWIIDPLDGTKHYVRQLPIFNISVALQHKNDLIFGMSYWPAYDDLFWGAKGIGSFRNEMRVSPSKTEKLADSFMYVDLPNVKYSKREIEKGFSMISDLASSCYRIRCFADAHAALCWIAAGGFDGYMAHVPRVSNYWDVAAGYVILKEAGGKITDLRGNEIKNLKELTDGFIASNGKIHQELVDLINSRVD